ncbi:hypothetical protein FOVG_19510 [Fusarium oxysporum f. sp. pisi HDV247]|uniref:Uncharacterized protein n=1 Tax=Fusarium oxysporum f. sp. pisi HDV247 TaxID=1080344 RepID=W9N8H5_FUSOX|nr:hypothetical protein FOVG_19510 [Fusarium oxysporum f. sp. pisi HDV247]
MVLLSTHRVEGSQQPCSSHRQTAIIRFSNFCFIKAPISRREAGGSQRPYS